MNKVAAISVWSVVLGMVALGCAVSTEGELAPPPDVDGYVKGESITIPGYCRITAYEPWISNSPLTLQPRLYYENLGANGCNNAANVIGFGVCLVRSTSVGTGSASTGYTPPSTADCAWSGGGPCVLPSAACYVHSNDPAVAPGEFTLSATALNTGAWVTAPALAVPRPTSGAYYYSSRVCVGSDCPSGKDFGVGAPSGNPLQSKGCPVQVLPSGNPTPMCVQEDLLNIAPQGTASKSYTGPASYANDGLRQPTSCSYAEVENGGWIEIAWPTARRVFSVRLDITPGSCGISNHIVKGANLQYWTGSAWVTDKAIGGAALPLGVSFTTPRWTTKVRLSSLQVTDNTGYLYELEVRGL